ncbi:hypothetical protein BDV25DRAFT_54890 [Aspergillus avenaceus]|uniref:Uncharacterized protein n=1 Tax=Aspergillus avenaceus TaxID=36643 RepID=A0A5N6TII5_ASPAV|nr:hypothetical protein BDV25DRAFT_54890 [Aspergillus avenaceus]
MPGIVGTSTASLGHLDRPLFRAHKSLPRKPNGDPSVHVINASPSGHDNDSSNGAVLATASALPLTPPGLTHNHPPTPKELEMPKFASPYSSSGAATPSKPSHPPTPETTPPRLPATTYRPTLGGQFGQTSCSSRAGSFQTAYEAISDGDTETPHRSSPSSHQSSRQKIQRSSPSNHSDGRSRGSPSAVEHSDSFLKPYRFEGINGEWATEHADKFAASRRRRRSSRNWSPDAIADVPEQPRHMDSVGTPDLNVPKTRDRNVRVRVRDSQDASPSPLPEQVPVKIDWSAEGRTDPMDTEDPRRFSGVSTSSTIEVMIVDSPQPYKPALRHSEKRNSLRSTSSSIPRSERTSLVSNPDSQHRLVHKAARISDHDRRSVASEMSISGSSIQAGLQQQVEVVPVVVIPERHSSLKSSASSSRIPSQSSSQPSSRRTRTRSGSRPDSFDSARQKRRNLSGSSAASHRDADSRTSGPAIPPRSSSLSAPTSQSNSRAPSLASQSSRSRTLTAETEPQNQTTEPPPPEPTKPMRSTDGAPDVIKTQSIIIGFDDSPNLRSPSGAFTQGSIPSSSPGLVEINEATTVAFFPHNNESLLVVDPQKQYGPQGLALRVEYQGTPARLEFPQIPEHQMMGPALQNPRPPPAPPVCTVIPPTPVNEADREPATRLSNPETTERTGRKFGSFRRAWAQRPRSDSFNTLARSFSVTSAKNRKAGKDLDGNLHPFWRPRKFWENTSPLKGEFPADVGPRSPTEDTDQVISNSLGMPQQRVVFQGPPIARRSARSFEDAESRRQARESLVGSRVFMSEALYSQTSLHQRRYFSLSWWRMRLRFGSVRNVRKRLRRSLQQRVEGKQEARRERLKQSIGEAVLMDSSTQTLSMVLQ